MARRRITLGLAVAGLLTTGLVATAATAATAAPAPEAARGQLTVKVLQPGARPGKVTVRGPGGFRRTVARTTTLRRLPAGRYRISAAAVSTKAWRATATVSRRSIRIRPGARGRTVIDYATVVSRKVKPVAPSAVEEFTAPEGLGATGELVSSASVPVGSVVASSSGTSAPDGLLVKVLTAERTGGDYTYEVRQASLQEAIPAGEFATSFTADLTDPAARRAARRGGRADSGASAPTALPVECTGSAEAGLSASAYGGIDMSLSAKWDFADSSVTVRATPRAGAQVRAWAAAVAECGLEDHLLFQRRFAPINLQVGPVPVVILPKLEMFVGGTLSASGAIESTGTVGLRAELRATASRKGLTTGKDGPTFTNTAGLETSATASAEVYAKARVTGEVYGVAGPHAQVRIAVEAVADKDADPWWRVDGTLRAGVGVKVDKCVTVFFKDLCLRLDKSKDDLLSARERIIDSGGPFDAGEEIGDDVAGDGVTVEDSDTDEDGGGTGRVDIGGGDQWVLSTGSITEVATTSVDGAGDAYQASTDRSAPGNETLSALSGADTYDATFVRFDVVPTGNRLRVDYLFASEEYPEYVGDGYNDVMGVFVGGENCAVVPGTSTAVSVDSINGDSNSQYFVDNLAGTRPTTMDGLTTPLHCERAVTPGQEVSVLIGVADSGDSILDSAVALLDGGITSYTE